MIPAPFDIFVGPRIGDGSAVPYDEIVYDSSAARFADGIDKYAARYHRPSSFVVCHLILPCTIFLHSLCARYPNPNRQSQSRHRCPSQDYREVIHEWAGCRKVEKLALAVFHLGLPSALPLHNVR